MIERSDVGAWVVKGNPNTWDYFGAAYGQRSDRHGRYESAWTLHRSYRTSLIRKGDLIALWITTYRDAGIYEIGRVTGEARPVTGMELSHLRDLSRADQPYEAVDYLAVRLVPHVPSEWMKNHRVLSKCEHFRTPQLGNPTYFTPSEVRALSRRIHPEGLKTAGWPVS